MSMKPFIPVAAVLCSHAAFAQTHDLTTGRLLFGEVAVEIRTTSDLMVRVGAADGTQTITLLLLARDVKRWADSASRLLNIRPPRPSLVKQKWTATLDEPGIEAGALTLTKTREGKAERWSLYVADREFKGVGAAIERDEVRALIGQLRRASASVLPQPKKSTRRPRVVKPQRSPPGDARRG
jgi:hypothetical protein